MDKEMQKYRQTPDLPPILPVEYHTLLNKINLAIGFRARGLISEESKIIDEMQSFMSVIEEENKKLTQVIEEEKLDQDGSEAK